MAMELIVQPLPIICWVSHTVVEYTFPSHLIISEFSLVIGLVLKDKFTMTVFFTIEGHSFKATPILISLYGEHSLLFVILFHHGFIGWLIVPISNLMGSRCSIFI